MKPSSTFSRRAPAVARRGPALRVAALSASLIAAGLLIAGQASADGAHTGHGTDSRAERHAHAQGERPMRGHAAGMGSAMGSNMWQQMDTDGDGRISRSEFEQGQQQSQKQALERRMKQFDLADADGDGHVSREEMQAWRETMRARMAEAEMPGRMHGSSMHGGSMRGGGMHGGQRMPGHGDQRGPGHEQGS
jgi:hypothetical protein